MGVEGHLFEELIDNYKLTKGVLLDTDLDESDWDGLIINFKELVKKEKKINFPQDEKEQLLGAINAVFLSWDSQRAKTYRKLNQIPDHWGTAVNVQAMVFGNMGDDCSTGVAFTRNPSTGDNSFFGEFLINAQGEDVVAGTRTPQYITKKAKQDSGSKDPSMEEAMPKVYKELAKVFLKLERHYKDMQDIEFTVENNKLWMLQTRSGKRTAKAAIKIAVDMVKEKLISKKEAIKRIDPNTLATLLHPTLEDKVEPMGHVRKMIASHMKKSRDTSVHVYSTSEVDMTGIVQFRNSNKASFNEKYQTPLTYTPFIIDAVIKAVHEYPLINACLDGENIKHNQNISIGVAVALPDDNLIVPVIKRAEELNFLGLARSTNDLAVRARSGKLNPDEAQGSTFTVTNPGIFGSLFGMGIINQPNVGLLSVGAIHKRPVVKETEYGDVVVPRSMMYLTLAYDHRLIDGAYGTKFLNRIKELLESFNENDI